MVESAIASSVALSRGEFANLTNQLLHNSSRSPIAPSVHCQDSTTNAHRCYISLDYLLAVNCNLVTGGLTNGNYESENSVKFHL